MKDLDGKAVDAQNWGAQFADDEFAVSGVEFLNVFPDNTDVDLADQPQRDEEQGEEEGALNYDEENPIKARRKSWAW